MSAQQRFASAFYNELLGLGLYSQAQTAQLTALALAQAQHESANFSSNLCVTYNNCIGYLYVNSQWQSGYASSQPIADGGHAYGAYSSLENCARELANYIKRRKSLFANVETVTEYATVLKQQGYYGDNIGNYINGMASFYEPPAGNYSTDEPNIFDQVSGIVKGGGAIYVVLAFAIGLVVYSSVKVFRMLGKTPSF